MSITDDLKKKLQNDLEQLKTMRDEIRVKLHLASMEAKERLKGLEPKLEELDRKLNKSGEDVSQATSKMFEELGQAFRDLGERLTGKGKGEGGEGGEGGEDKPDKPDTNA